MSEPPNPSSSQAERRNLDRNSIFSIAWQNIQPKAYCKRLLHKWFRVPIEDRPQLEQAFQEAHQTGIINSELHNMLHGVLAIEELRVRDVMSPRPSMQVIEQNNSIHKVLEIIKDSLHSRYPVVNEDNRAVGVLYVKDLVTLIDSHSKDPLMLENLSLDKLIRKVEAVAEDTRLSLLLKRFQRAHKHLAIVIDEHGELTGLITIEDVLEQIVGEIRDEFDEEQDIWIIDYDNKSTVKALTPLEEFNRHFKTDLISNGSETIAGFVLSHCQQLPKQGEVITIGNLQFQILKVDNRRIHLLSLKILDQNTQ